jgi:hypothetical protein
MRFLFILGQLSNGLRLRFPVQTFGACGVFLVSLLVSAGAAATAAPTSEPPACSASQRAAWDFAWSETLGVTVADPTFVIG